VPLIIVTIAPEIVHTVAGAAARVGVVLALVVATTVYVDWYGAVAGTTTLTVGKIAAATVVVSVIVGAAV
jgi:hypothetical protein